MLPSPKVCCFVLGELPVLRCKCLRSACGVRSVVKVQVVPVLREVRRGYGLEKGASAAGPHKP